ncbi:hypothetical protein DL96DRAFT_1706431 [Flagelloscypha sp. PMI_526]|nr:hypothetical protein DL96DRAFT_1706431 [Flagelloscypha sp. PMI_526]
MPPERPSDRATPKRTYHEKSRAGCRSCKARRVKCDETHPICGTCDRRKEACIWDDFDPPNPLELVLGRRANATLIQSCQRDPPPSNNFAMTDLELLHNWTTNTLQTFIPDIPHTRHGFQVILPQCAFRYDFLLHSMFAISSLHMHMFRPSEDFLRLAKMHCQRAVLGLDISGASTSWEITWMANVLLSIYWIASPSWRSYSQDGPPDLFDWFPTARTYMHRLSPYWSAVVKGAVTDSPVLPHTLADVKKPIPRMPSPFPTILENIHREEVCPFDPDELKDAKVVACYDRLVRKLSKIWNIFMHPDLQNLAIYLFPTAVRDDFFIRFQQRRPRALIIVAHYCALLSQFGTTWWYGIDRAHNDIQRILSLLDAKWLPWMEYPLAVIKMEESRAEFKRSEAMGRGGGHYPAGNKSMSAGSGTMPLDLLLSQPHPSSSFNDPAQRNLSNFSRSMLPATQHDPSHRMVDHATAHESRPSGGSTGEDPGQTQVAILALSSMDP